MTGDKKFQTKVLTCKECNEEFVFTSEAQEYFAERGYKDDPKRCKTCHQIFKKSQGNSDHQPGANQSR